MRIARLAAGGLSNPEIAQQLFVTRKTVETHLSHVFMKLDITGRGELPGVLGVRASRGESAAVAAAETPLDVPVWG